MQSSKGNGSISLPHGSHMDTPINTEVGGFVDIGSLLFFCDRTGTWGFGQQCEIYICILKHFFFNPYILVLVNVDRISRALAHLTQSDAYIHFHMKKIG